MRDFISALCFVLSVAKEYYFVAGKVENWVVLIEAGELGLFNFPFKVKFLIIFLGSKS